MADKGRITRRAALGLIGGGAFVAASETFGFTNMTATRGTNVTTTDDPHAIVGLLINDQVQKNNQELLADVTNGVDQDLSVTFSLDDPTQGTLYGPDGSSGDSVTFPLAAGNTKSVDIGADVDGETIFFTITADSTDFSFQATRETEAVAGNTEGAVEITKLQNFDARTTDNDWGIQQIEVVSNVGANSLDRVEYEVTDRSGTVVGSLTHNASGDVYERKGNPNSPGVVIEPNDGYTLQSGETYGLTVTGWDDADNFDTATRSDTA